MTLCDRCFDPGRCCKQFDLSGGGSKQPFVERASTELTFWMDEGLAAVRAWLSEADLPFTPLRVKATYVASDSERQYATYWYSCPHLTEGGRCEIYDDRPRTCRDMTPGVNTLCVHAGGAEAAEPTIPMMTLLPALAEGMSE